MEDQTRNLDAHKPARIAQMLYNYRYVSQRGGTMDFWDSLTDGEKKTCRFILKTIESSREELLTPNNNG